MQFATAINCMDGRVQLPVILYLQDKLGVDVVDMITEAGPVKVLAEGHDMVTIESILNRVRISVNKHGSKHIAIVGHTDCAGNPADRALQEEQLRESRYFLSRRLSGVETIGLYVNETWEVEEVE